MSERADHPKAPQLMLMLLTIKLEEVIGVR